MVSSLRDAEVHRCSCDLLSAFAHGYMPLHAHRPYLTCPPILPRATRTPVLQSPQLQFRSPMLLFNCRPVGELYFLLSTTLRLKEQNLLLD